MWKCPFCGSDNLDDGKFCAGCGSRRPAEAPQPGAGAPSGAFSGQSAAAYAPPQQTPPAKNDTVKKIAIVAAAVVALAAIVVFFVHSWKPATCIRPETCSICGKTQGVPLGHKWTAATCTEPETCSRCGETVGAALGHKWRDATCTEPKTCRRCGVTEGRAAGHSWAEATYDAPKTCLVCGEQTGLPRGFIGELYGTWSDVSLSLDNQTCYPFVLSTPVKDCFRLKMDLKLSNIQGSPYGAWNLYIRDLNGNWTKAEQFTVDNRVDGQFVTYEFEFSTPKSFTAIVPMVDKNSVYFQMLYYVDFYDVQVLEE